jgi:hypothetical protein
MADSFFHMALNFKSGSSEDSSWRETNVGLSVVLWACLVFATLLLGAMVAVFAHWREMPEFWQNRGGYPIWLRHFVLISYYPLLLTYMGIFLAECLYLKKERYVLILALKMCMLLPVLLLLLLIVLKTLS